MSCSGCPLLDLCSTRILAWNQSMCLALWHASTRKPVNLHCASWLILRLNIFYISYAWRWCFNLWIKICLILPLFLYCSRHFFSHCCSKVLMKYGNLCCRCNKYQRNGDEGRCWVPINLYFEFSIIFILALLLVLISSSLISTILQVDWVVFCVLG